MINCDTVCPPKVGTVNLCTWDTVDTMITVAIRLLCMVTMEPVDTSIHRGAFRQGEEDYQYLALT